MLIREAVECSHLSIFDNGSSVIETTTSFFHTHILVDRNDCVKTKVYQEIKNTADFCQNSNLNIRRLTFSLSKIKFY
jgi:hypothetical protein